MTPAAEYFLGSTLFIVALLLLAWATRNQRPR